MKIKILRYPHGYIGGIYDGDVCPTITTSDFANNNFLIEYETEEPKILLEMEEYRFNYKRVQQMIDDGKISGAKVQYVDAYNQSVNDDVASTITARVDDSNHLISEPISCASRKRGDEHKIGTRKEDVANCVTIIDTDSMVQEPQILTPSRTEEGRQLRKQGIEKFCNRALYPRTDGISNCLTGVLKDNLLREPKEYINNPMLQNPEEAPVSTSDTGTVENGIQYKGKWMMEGNAVDTSRSETFGTHVMKGVSPTLRSERPDANAVCVKENDNTPLVVTREYTDYGGMSRPFSKINISRVCTIGEFFNKFIDTFSYDLSNYKGKIYFRYDFDETQNEVVFENLDDALKSEILIIRLNGKFYDAWYDDKPWQFCGLKLQYPGYVKTVPKIHYRIRKLTEREVFRLMGLEDEDIDKIQAAGISKTAQYKLAGNSIVVDVLYHIFKSLFIDKDSRYSQGSLF